MEPSTPTPPDDPKANKVTFEPPDKHVAVDRAGKILVTMAGSINKALGTDEPIVVNRKGRHVSIQGLEELIDKALEG